MNRPRSSQVGEHAASRGCPGDIERLAVDMPTSVDVSPPPNGLTGVASAPPRHRKPMVGDPSRSPPSDIAPISSVLGAPLSQVAWCFSPAASTPRRRSQFRRGDVFWRLIWLPMLARGGSTMTIPGRSRHRGFLVALASPALAAGGARLGRLLPDDDAHRVRLEQRHRGDHGAHRHRACRGHRGRPPAPRRRGG